jgi:putative pyridoxal-dependent aspartate 1-decarboxylase
MSDEDLWRRYFLTQENEGEWHSLMAEALAEAFEIVKPRVGGKICSDVSLQALEKIFSETSAPDCGQPLSDVLRETRKKVLAHSVRVADPRFVGHMTGALPYFGLMVDILISALNQNVVKIETALSASFVEKQTLAWLHQLVFSKSNDFYAHSMHRSDVSLGNVTNGGTLGNLTALTVARNRLLPEAGSEGLAAAMVDRGMRRLVILASRRVHYSVKKAASILGIGAKNVLEIPVVPGTNRVDLVELEATLNRLEKHKTGVLALVGIAGTTETGSVDKLVDLARIARDRGIWFHVDAAWGGALMLSNKHRHLVQGIELADSVVLDGHKLFYLTLSHGMVLFKDEHSLDAVRHSAHYIIRPGSVDLGRTSLEGSRRFDSLKLWFFLKTMGRSGYGALIDRTFATARTFADLIEGHPSFDLTSVPETNILTYRYVPEEWKPAIVSVRSMVQNTVQDLGAQEPSGTEAELLESARFVAEFLNEVNIEIQKQQRLLGLSFVSRTTLESVYPGVEVVVLRAVLMNPFTTSEILAEILAEQDRLGRRIVADKWKRALRNAPRHISKFFGTLPDVPC